MKRDSICVCACGGDEERVCEIETAIECVLEMSETRKRLQKRVERAATNHCSAAARFADASNVFERWGL